MRFLSILSAVLLSFACIAAPAAMADDTGNPEHGSPQKSEGRPGKRQMKTGQPQSNVGFIADPVPRKLNLTGASKVAIPSPVRVVPVVRDHTLPNPNALPPNYHGPGRSDSINGGGLGLGNPFSFTAPLQFEQIRDQRSSAYPGSRKGGHNTPWTPNTQGPANRSPKP